MPKRISAANKTPVRVVVVTLDNHLASTINRAQESLGEDVPNLTLTVHAAVDWSGEPESLTRCQSDIAQADIIIVTMLFVEEHIQAIMGDLEARREDCDAIVACMSAGEVIRLSRLGRFDMAQKQSGAIAWLKRLRGSRDNSTSNGANQMALLRRIPRMLRFVPGTAQDVRAYFLTMQYWLACSEDNLANMVRYLVDRYATGEREALAGALDVAPPVDYPDAGLYHPSIKAQTTERISDLPKPSRKSHGTVGLLVMRSYVLAGDTAHYDTVISAFEARGIRVIPAFASGLDSRPAIERFFIKDGESQVDSVLSLTGFSLVGGPAYNDASAAEEMLAKLDVPYVAAHALEFQTLDKWQSSDQGLMPVEATMMVAIPELDGATGPMVFGGRSDSVEAGPRHMQADPDRVELLVARIARQIELRQTAVDERRLGVVLFNFPPNAGATGTAAYLAVFESLYNTLLGLKAEGYDVDVPESVDALRTAILEGNAAQFGADANVHLRIPADDHVRREPYLSEIEDQWGPAPGRQLSDGASIHVLGAQFGKIFVGVQPGFGYEGDPMRLLFEKGFAPTHAFSAFYRYLKEDFAAHAVLHFGTHGALEFMPGKQTGLSSTCWPDRLIGDLPNFNLYAANNPSEGMIAKRRAAATLVSYLTPPLQHAGLYRGLLDLKASLDRWRSLAPENVEERERVSELIQIQAAEIDLVAAEPVWNGDATAHIEKLSTDLHEFENALIPHGMHVIGTPANEEERSDLLEMLADSVHSISPSRASLDALVAGESAKEALQKAEIEVDDDSLAAFEALADTSQKLSVDHEIPALMHALDGGFVRPAPGGDLLRTPSILPTGRNIHGFDPYRLPSAFAVADGLAQAERLLARARDDGNALPESVALVLWGTDNLKSEGGPIGQALGLMGAEPRFDSFGHIVGATLIDLETLGRPRIDVVMTLSGIFRDLLPLQTSILAEAAYLAATADEPVEQNFIRKHTLAYQAENDCDIETAALRVFSNADGAYGANVNQLIDCGSWDDEDDLGDTFTARKSFAHGRSGKPVQQRDLLNQMLADVELTYQNLESVELGVTTVDHYFDSLGGITKAVSKARGKDVPVYISDQTRNEGVVRSLDEQVELETRTRTLNPAWYEGMLKHGYEGVRQIEEHVTNTLGWSATTGQVAPWVYKQITQVFVLDKEMRDRLADLNPKASVRVANRLLEAHERNYWTPDDETLEALRRAGDELEDRLEGINAEAAA